jgi:hypothetical protein
MKSTASNPLDYINSLPAERKEAISKLRDIVIKNLPKGFSEVMNYGMLGYVVPHSLYPNGYHADPKQPLPFMNIASQKNFIAFYYMGFGNKKILEWFENEYPKHCHTKLDMGKSCIRFKKIDQIPYELIGELVQKITMQQWIEFYEKELKRSSKN